jgi:hypothetical protein
MPTRSSCFLLGVFRGIGGKRWPWMSLVVHYRGRVYFVSSVEHRAHHRLWVERGLHPRVDFLPYIMVGGPARG